MIEKKIKCATFNINGMKDRIEKSQLKHTLNSHNFDILFLQETHIDSMSLANSLKTQINCDCYWSLGSNRSEGVGILIFPSLNFKVEKFESDIERRFLFVDLLINSIPYRLMNIYAPNNEKDRKYFSILYLNI